MLNDLWLGWKFTLSYFTILPVMFKKGINLDTKEILGYFLFWLPSIGLILSSISIGIFLLIEPLGWLGALISAISYMMLYGFVHTEAIIDVVDALYAKHSNKDAYSVIKEPTIGALGALWGFAIMLIKVASFSFLLLHHQYLYIIAIATISRLSILILFYIQKFKSSFLDKLQQNFTTQKLISSYILFSIIGISFIGVWFVYMLIVGVAISYIVSQITTKSLGFCNGDVVGFSLELCEMFLMILVSVYHL